MLMAWLGLDFMARMYLVDDPGGWGLRDVGNVLF